MFGIIGFKENITDPRDLGFSDFFNFTDPRHLSNMTFEIINKSNPYDLGEVSVFISAVLLSLGGCFAVVASNIRRSRCVTIDCGISKCSRKIPNDEDIGV